MGDAIKNTGDEAIKRWHEKMPRFFRKLMVLCGFVAGTALTVNTAITMGNGTPHEWWNELYPYLLGVPAGVAFACKFTVQGGFDGKVDVDRLTKNTVLENDDF